MQQMILIQNILLEIANKDPEAMFVCVDGAETVTIHELKEIFPDKVISCGISEQNSHGIAAGLALGGKNVFLIQLGPFAVQRTFDQLKNDIAYTNANVTILSLKSGIKYNATAGYSHWGIEDIALVRTLPNIEILTPASLDNLRDALDYAHKNYGPKYIRVDNYHSEFNIKPIKKTENYELLSVGNNAVVFSIGAMTEYVYDVQNKLKNIGINITIVNCTKLKPFDKTIVEHFANKKIPMFSIEEHTYGGLATIISEILSSYGKEVVFSPLVVNHSGYNLVGGYEYVISNVLKSNLLFENIIKLACKKYKLFNIPILTLKYAMVNNQLIKIKYTLLNIFPILGIKQTQNRKKYYIFNIIQVLNKKINKEGKYE